MTRKNFDGGNARKTPPHRRPTKNERLSALCSTELVASHPEPILDTCPECGDYEMSVRIVALLALAASFALAPSNANAGLFGRGGGCDSCCDVEPSCGCEIAPSCGCEVVDPCCDPCGGKRMGLFAKLRARKAASSCCDPCAAPTCGCEMAAPSCCAPAPTCCAPAPSCGCEIAPSCGCEVDPCCDPCAKKKRGGFLKGLFAKCKKKDSCCDPCAAPTCGCEIAAPSCGCEIAPSCGCGCN